MHVKVDQTPKHSTAVCNTQDLTLYFDVNCQIQNNPPGIACRSCDRPTQRFAKLNQVRLRCFARTFSHRTNVVPNAA